MNMTYFVSVSEIRRASSISCVLSDSTGQLWLVSPPRLDEIILPSSRGGHGLFAVQYHHDNTDGEYSVSLLK